MLDCVLGGGWALDRVINIVGDKSTGKTLLAIEGCANFHRSVPDGRLVYLEAESAFDRGYASRLGFPADAELRNDVYTVDQLFTVLEELANREPHRPTLVVIDSLDALSVEAEQKNALGDQGYGAVKPKLLSELFRRLNSKLAQAHITLMVISQVRENIGVTFGAKYTRSGGKALDFYASQIIWLSEGDKIELTLRGNQRRIGVNVRSRVTKNKIGPPFREVAFQLLYGYGVDDIHTNLFWLKTCAPEALQELGIRERSLRDLTRLHDPALRARIADVARREYHRIESAFDFAPRKYGEEAP